MKGLTLDYRAISDIGRCREGNEDSFFATDSQIGVLPNLFIVADGMGGHNAGEVASALAVSSALDFINSCGDLEPKDALLKSIEYANQKVYIESNEVETEKGMGTTFCACSVFPDRILVSAVGDSRLYIRDDQGLVQITMDHTVAEEMVRYGSITREMANTHPKKHMLTRVVGVVDTVEPDFFEVRRDGVYQILLASDGLTNMLTDDEISDILKEDSDAGYIAGRLVDTANKNGGEDNITVILINLERK